eukprot:CAMPEP_0177701302 /NCGR_PEP_ID=MMETSP0484_2-20121128/6542_1 /TAXON_ID=354590 /ORGANISM="Rhodomonas lens, Strain RHODO" /LENGTH=447 /DNA_ID=CAMNT_0019212533 /DNA_START=138 /DNA_END=1477 /DNA_ORIENTATION=+
MARIGSNFAALGLCMLSWLVLASIKPGAAASADGDISADDPKDFIMSFDVDGDDKLSVKEYAALLSTLRDGDDGSDENEDEKTAAAAFQVHDTSGDGKLDFDEIVAMLSQNIDRTPPACQAPSEEAAESEDEPDLSDLSDLSDLPEDEPGLSDIPPEYFKKDFKAPPDPDWGEDEQENGGGDAVEFAMRFDKNKDGLLSLGEFLIMMEEEGGDSDDELIQFFRQGDLDKDRKLNAPEINTLFYNPHQRGQMAEELAAGGASKQARAQGGASFGTDDPRGSAAGHKPPLSALDSRRLYQIVQGGDLAELEEALAVVYSPDGGAEDGECTPLHLALSMFDAWNHQRHLLPHGNSNYTAAAILLVEHGADLRAECEGRTALQWAVQCRNQPLATRILRELKSKIDAGTLAASELDALSLPSDYAPGGGTALHAACYIHGLAIGVSKILVG